MSAQPIITRFESVNAFVSAVDKSANRYGSFWPSRGASWDCDVDGTAALTRAIDGDPEVTPAALSQLVSLQTHASGGTRNRYVNAIAGSRVDVPAYLANTPACMKRRMRVEHETRHVSLYVSTACQGSVQAESMLARGTAILALLEYLQANGTSVDLYLLAELADDGRDHWTVIRVETRPLDISTSGFAIAHPAFGRKLCYAWAESQGDYHGQWSSAAQRLDKSSPAWGAYVRKELGLAPGDVLVPYAVNADQIVQDPGAWLAARIQQLSAEVAA